jgi:non-ribosomal peptide synthetase component E (peptide arylation enzyme)
LTIAEGQDIVFEEMITFLKERGLAIHKLPEALRVLDRLPVLVEGQKVNKIALKEMMIERMKQS